MIKPIHVLQQAIDIQLENLEKHVTEEHNEKSSMHFEYLAELKDNIQECRRAIAVLKYFSMEDVLEGLLKKGK